MPNVHQATLLDVTDLVEFLQRRESVSGVQRVVAETVPLVVERTGARTVILDRGRGVFIELTAQEFATLVAEGARSRSRENRDALAQAAEAALARAHAEDPVVITQDTVLVVLGALWISDALMLAVRDAHAHGARIVALLYDLTPVMRTGHTAAVNNLFERYLTLLAQTASRVPAISRSSRDDFMTWFDSHAGDLQVTTPTPGGAATGLPCGITPGQFPDTDSPWPRPYALFVGTVESRKNHILALNAWRRLIEDHGADRVPDLVCIGRLGWHASEFLREYVYTRGLGGKVTVLSGSLTDPELAQFYAHAQFTLYPSSYEGWGLPVSESLAFGKVTIVADNSSLPEAGGDLACYFTSDDLNALVACVEANALDEEARARHERRILEAPPAPITWEHVADVIVAEIDAARTTEGRSVMAPMIELGREYVLATRPPAPDEGHADQYMAYLQAEGLTPLLRQPRGERDFETTDAVVTGTFGSPQTWGLELRPGCRADVRFTRPVEGALTLLLATRAMPGRITIDASGPGGPLRQEVYLGSVLALPLGAGKTGETAQLTLAVADAQDSVEGFLGLRSFVVLRADDSATEILALQAATDALRQELDFLQNTRSWKLTAPLRRWKGRASG